MAQVVQNAHKQDNVELFAQIRDSIDIQFAKLDLCITDLRCKTRLFQITGIRIDTKYASGSAAFHLDRIETRITTDIENGFAAQIGRNRMFEAPPFEARIIAQEVIGGSLNSAEVQ